MSKPDWKDAPPEMDWLAQDMDLSWWWYVDKPILVACGWLPSEVPARHQLAIRPSKQIGANTNYAQTLERRP